MRQTDTWALGPMLAVAVALGCVAPSLAHAQQAAPAGEPVCLPPKPTPAFFQALQERLLTPGKTFNLRDLPPDAMKQIGAHLQDAAARQARDWPALCYYAEKNAAVLNGGRRPHVIFMGDSITENWLAADPAMFSPSILDRGISGQTAPQMLLRMYADVINLRPDIVHIMAGTNDIFGNTGPETDQTIVDHIRAMIVLAKANGVKVVLGSITPSAGWKMRPDFNPSARIIHVNALLRQLATEQRVVFVDYHTPLAGDGGGMHGGLANDGLHPNRDGYAIMRPLAQRAIVQAEKQP